MVYGSNQWISFDDAQSFKSKVQFLTGHCLRGLSVWSIDWDTSQLAGSAALFGDEATSRAIIEDTLDKEEKEALVSDLAAYTGQNCYITHTCVTSDTGSNAAQLCQAGYSSVGVANNPDHIGPPVFMGDATCKQGEYKHICCPTKQMPKNCEWSQSNPSRSLFASCNSTCGSDQFTLTQDSAYDTRGDQPCFPFTKRSVSPPLIRSISLPFLRILLLGHKADLCLTL
jgi:chitinase